DMGSRPLLGTTDWKRYDIVADVPAEAENVIFAASLSGKGTLWVDGLEVAIVKDDVPVTDDSIWHSWSYTPQKYTAALDRLQTRNGHPTLCLSSTTASIAAKEWFAYDHNDRHIDDLRGKR